MKKLEPTIKGRGEVRGFTFTRIKETENVYVYEQRFDETGEVLGYEVFEKKYNSQFDCESYPKSEAFGVWAYSVGDIDKTEVYVKLIEERCKKRMQRILERN